MPINIQTVESNQRLSDSIVWSLQKEALKKNRSTKKDDDRMTTRASFCAVYIDFVLSFLQDYADRLDRNEPVYILELGALRGAFSLKVLTGLKKKMADFDKLRDLKIRYIMSDWQSSGFDLCRQNQHFASQIKSGELDFALIEDPEQATLHLMVQDKTLASEDFKNPLVVLANHYFEMTRQDAFTVHSHKSQLRLYTFFRDSNLYPRDTPLELEQLKCARGEIRPEWPKYEEPHFNDILAQYEQAFADASIIFPVAALRLLNKLTELTEKNLVVFAADRGHTETACFQFEGSSHEYILHDRCLTFDVNFDAIARSVKALGGSSLLNGGDAVYLATAAFFLLKETDRLEQCHHFWHEVIEAKDPFNVSYNIEQLLFKLLTKASAAAITSDQERFGIFMTLLRFGDYDAEIFTHAYELILPKEGVEFVEFDQRRRKEIIVALRRVFANIVYPASSLSALEKIADLQLLMGDYDDCIRTSELANAAVGPQPYFFDRLAMAYRAKKQFAQATEILQECLRQFPDHPWPTEEMERLENDRLRHEAINTAGE